MASKKHPLTTEQLQQKLVKRIMQVVACAIAVFILLVVLPAQSLAPTPLSPLLDSSHGSVPSSPLLAHPSLAWIPVVVAVILLGPILYGVYDSARIFLALRSSQQDDQMFP
jgi:hypothetical protein